MGMRRSRLLKGLAAVAAAATVTAAQVAQDVQPADAIILPSSFVALSKPLVALAANQAAGNVRLTFGGPYLAGDTLLLTVSPPGGNCTSATNYVAFRQPPTVSVGGGTVILGPPTLARTAANCVANGRNDTVVIPIVNSNLLSLLETQTVTVSNIVYDLGATTTIGDITVSFTSPNALLPGLLSGPLTAANATTQTLGATGNAPPVALVPNSGPQMLSPVTITELRVGAIPANRFICLTISGPPLVRFIPGGPVPSVTGPNVTPGSVAVSTTTVSFMVSASSATTATYTLNNLSVATGVALGPVTGLVGVYSTRDPGTLTCSGLDALAFSPVRLGVVIQRARLSGLDRFGTAATAFRAAFPCVDNAVLTRGDDFPDALSASYLAGRLGTGILLTRTDVLEPAVVSALQASGVRNVFVLGGPTAVSDGVAAAISNLPSFTCGAGAPRGVNFNVTRLGGESRYATNAQAVTFPGPAAVGSMTLAQAGTFGLPAQGATVPDPKRTAIVVSGANFPDALAAGPVAAAGAEQGGAGFSTPGGFPLILTDPAALSPSAATALVNLGIGNVLLMGGTSAISSAVEGQIQSLTGSIRTLRFAGADRFETAAQFAVFEVLRFADLNNTLVAGLGYTPPSTVWLARGDDFPDALAGGPVAATFGPTSPSPILLVTGPTILGPATTAFLRTVRPFIFTNGATYLGAFGGTTVLANALMESAATILAE